LNVYGDVFPKKSLSFKQSVFSSMGGTLLNMTYMTK